jgi:RNA polymerase sigma-70 factor (ECF subfamily)
VAEPEPFHPDSDAQAAAVYNELRQLAAAYMRRERQGFTLQATALVHEAYLRLAGTDLVFNDRHHFIGIAARSMRQILVDRARARGAQKRWAGLDRVSLTDSLEQIDPEQARIIELRYFVGLSIEEAAEAMHISPATLKRRFAMARAWLFRELQGGAA